jgi:hypothetical protein
MGWRSRPDTARAFENRSLALQQTAPRLQQTHAPPTRIPRLVRCPKCIGQIHSTGMSPIVS